MKRLNYLREAALAELRASVDANVDRYRAPAAFLKDYFAGRDADEWLCESALQIGELPKLNPDDTGAVEAENAIALHKALAGLTESQAADDRLWSWLAHGPYWEYMRRRWKVETTRSNTIRDYILEHFFVGNNVRNLVRHGIARLWWFAQTTYDGKRTDPYELTRLMLEYSDNRQSVMERAFSRNRTLVQSILDRARWWRGQGKDILGSRDRFRGLCKEMNLHGGTLVLDCLPQSDVFELVDDFISRALPPEMSPASP